MSGPMTVGWCPGALRPMASGDGLILRVKPRGGVLTLDGAEALAALSLRFGNGHLDFTGRANLQIRGARPETVDPLTAGLREAGFLDADAEAEAVRNIVASPLAGLDPGCRDTGPLLAALEHRLATDPSLRRLPAKWSFVVDGGGRLPLAGVAADLRFRLEHAVLRIGLDRFWSEPIDGMFDLPKLLATLVTLAAAGPEPLRMKALLARCGLQAVFSQLGFRQAVQAVIEPVPVVAADLFGCHDRIVAIAPAFGGLSAMTLAEVVRAGRDSGAADLRLTPWRVLLVTGVADEPKLRARLAPLDLTLDAADPRLGVSACVGAPACHRASTATRADAALLAARLGRDLDGIVHVAGCAKGCGSPADARWTLVARDGLYDLLRDGDAAPRVTGLSSTEAANWLSRAEDARIS